MAANANDAPTKTQSRAAADAAERPSLSQLTFDMPEVGVNGGVWPTTTTRQALVRRFDDSLPGSMMSLGASAGSDNSFSSIGGGDFNTKIDRDEKKEETETVAVAVDSHAARHDGAAGGSSSSSASSSARAAAIAAAANLTTSGRRRRQDIAVRKAAGIEELFERRDGGKKLASSSTSPSAEEKAGDAVIAGKSSSYSPTAYAALAEALGPIAPARMMFRRKSDRARCA